MKYFQYIAIHFLFTLCYILGFYVFGATQWVNSILLGSLLMGLNMIFLFWIWVRVFLKKSVAPAIGLIVTKYAASAFVIFIISQRDDMSLVYFTLGTSVFIPSLFLYSFLNPKLEVAT